MLIGWGGECTNPVLAYLIPSFETSSIPCSYLKIPAPMVNQVK